MTNAEQKKRDARTAVVRAGRHTSTVVRVACTLCVQLPPSTRTVTGAVDHAHNNPGHVITVSTLQISTYGTAAEKT